MAADLAIRLARPTERDRLEVLQLRSSLAWEDYREALLANPDAVELAIKHLADGRVHVAERQGEPVGFSVLLPRSDGDADLDGLFVEPTAWRSRIGTKLLVNAEGAAARDGAMVLWVVANPRAEGFYVKCAFEQVGVEQTRFGRAVTMRKAIGSLAEGKGFEPSIGLYTL